MGKSVKNQGLLRFLTLSDLRIFKRSFPAFGILKKSEILV